MHLARPALVLVGVTVAPARRPAVGAPAATVGDAADFLDVDVDEVAGVVVFVALVAVAGGADDSAGERVAVGQPGHVMATQDPPACRRWYSGVAGQTGRAAPQPLACGQYPPLGARWCAGRAGAGSAGPVGETGLAFGVEAGDPAVGALTGYSELFGDVGDRAAVDTDAVDQEPAAVHGQPGVTVGHEDLLGGT